MCNIYFYTVADFDLVARLIYKSLVVFGKVLIEFIFMFNRLLIFGK